MFNNPGKKLKSLAKLIFWLAIVLNVLLFLGIYGGMVSEAGTDGDALALIVSIVLGLLIGALIGWLSSILLYAFGELIEDIHSGEYTTYYGRALAIVKATNKGTIKVSCEDSNVEIKVVG